MYPEPVPKVELVGPDDDLPGDRDGADIDQEEGDSEGDISDSDNADAEEEDVAEEHPNIDEPEADGEGARGIDHPQRHAICFAKMKKAQKHFKKICARMDEAYALAPESEETINDFSSAAGYIAGLKIRITNIIEGLGH